MTRLISSVRFISHVAHHHLLILFIRTILHYIFVRYLLCLLLILLEPSEK